MSNAAKTSLIALVALIALGVALLWNPARPEDRGSAGLAASPAAEADSSPAGEAGAAGTESRSSTAELEELRAAVRLASCPTGPGGAAGERQASADTGPADTEVPDAGPAASGPLAGIALRCLGDGTSVNLGELTRDRPLLLNLWAQWCEPCRAELPLLQSYAAAEDTAIPVLTVHANADEAGALRMLGELQVDLPGVQNGSNSVAAALSLPRALPVSVVLLPGGAIGATHFGPFTSVEQISATVQSALTSSAATQGPS